MSTVQPPPPPTVAPTTSGTATTPVLTLNAPPPALTALPPGSALNALVTTGTAQGQAQIETPLGTFLVSTKLPLKADQPLVLQIGALQGGPLQGSAGQAAGTQNTTALLLNVLEIAGRPTVPGLQTTQPIKPTLGTGLQSATNTPPVNTPGTPAAVAPSVSLLVGSSLNAITLTTITGAPPSPQGAQATPSPAGAVQSGPVPATLNAPAKGGAAVAQSSQTPVTGSVATTNTPNPPPRTFPAGGQFTLTIQSLTPPSGSGTPTATGSPFTIDSVIAGRVSGHTPSGQPVVQTAHGSVSLSTTQALPQGTDITFRIETLPDPAQHVRMLSSTQQRVGLLTSGSWPSLTESLGVIHGADPAMAQQINMVAVPKADVKMTATTLFFLSALRAGDVRGWIGDNATRLLDRLRPDVLQRLSSDFRALSDPADEAGAPRRTNEWRGTLIPFLNGDALEQIRLFTRQTGDEEQETDEATPETRFLVDITLTNIGRLQLDGMVASADKRLDMIVRTSTSLPDQVRADLMRLFSEANDVVGMRGGMVFQASPDGFVDPLEEMPADGEDSFGIIV